MISYKIYLYYFLIPFIKLNILIVFVVCVAVAPMVKVGNQLLGAPLHTDVRISCFVEAYPHAVVYWRNDDSEMLLNGYGYCITGLHRRQKLND